MRWLFLSALALASRRFVPILIEIHLSVALSVIGASSSEAEFQRPRLFEGVGIGDNSIIEESTLSINDRSNLLSGDRWFRCVRAVEFHQGSNISYLIKVAAGNGLNQKRVALNDHYVSESDFVGRCLSTVFEAYNEFRNSSEVSHKYATYKEIRAKLSTCCFVLVTSNENQSSGYNSQEGSGHRRDVIPVTMDRSSDVA